MIVGEQGRGPVDVPRDLWAATIERAFRDPAGVYPGHAMSGLEPCECCGVPVIGRQDKDTGERAVVEVLAIQYRHDPGMGRRGLAVDTRPHRCPARGTTPSQKSR